MHMFPDGCLLSNYIFHAPLQFLMPWLQQRKLAVGRMFLFPTVRMDGWRPHTVFLWTNGGFTHFSGTNWKIPLTRRILVWEPKERISSHGRPVSSRSSTVYAPSCVEAHQRHLSNFTYLMVRQIFLTKHFIPGPILFWILTTEGHIFLPCRKCGVTSFSPFLFRIFNDVTDFSQWHHKEYWESTRFAFFFFHFFFVLSLHHKLLSA